MKTVSRLAGQQALVDAIQEIARHGIVNRTTGYAKGAGRVTGYVTRVDAEKGLVDVQEFPGVEASADEPPGFHEDVKLSALQDNKGFLIVPKLYSEVVVATDPSTSDEYVVMFSHVDTIRLDSHESVEIGVKKRQPFDPMNEYGPDVNELPELGESSLSSYTSSSITHTVADKKSAVTVSQSSSEFSAGAGTPGKAPDTIIGVDRSTVWLGGKEETEHAVLGEALADILSDMLGVISQIKTATQLGPQPPMNVADVIRIKADINRFKSSCSGFLSRTVKVKK